MNFFRNKACISVINLVFLIIFLILVSGCAHTQKTPKVTPKIESSDSSASDIENNESLITSVDDEPLSEALIEPEPAPTEVTSAPIEVYSNAWDRLRFSQVIDTQSDTAAVQRELNYFLQKPDMIDRFTKRSSPYLTYILEALEREGLPLELAVLPFIESAYNPAATSRKGAAGLWQLMLGTARELKVKQTIWYDGRRDLIESTDAALDYLNFISQKYDQDWYLTLAAYNAGHNKVSRLIDKNLQANKGTSFWDLKLPKETRVYVPRFLAFLEMLRRADEYSIALPEVGNELSYQKVATNKPVDIGSLEKKLGLEKGQLTSLNNGYIREVTPPGKDWYLLVPSESGEKVPALLASMPSPDLSQHTLTHRIQRGETLSHIARRYGVRISHIQRVNNLSSSRIRAGKKLTIPAPILASQESYQPNDGEHIVQRGDTLWEIARRYHLSVADLSNLNQINSADLLKPGKILIIR